MFDQRPQFLSAATSAHDGIFIAASAYRLQTISNSPTGIHLCYMSTSRTAVCPLSGLQSFSVILGAGRGQQNIHTFGSGTNICPLIAAMRLVDSAS